MRPVSFVFVFVACAFIARAEVKTLGACESRFEAGLASGSHLTLHLRSGDIAITGSPDPGIVVSCETDRHSRHDQVEVKFMATGNSADLKVSGGSRNRFRLRIQVPAVSNLMLRATAGDVTIDGITGDKDVELAAGDLKIAVGSAADYARTEASVHVGGLEALPWSVQKGGFFRSFRHSNPGGKYYLNAHVGAGGITLH